MNRTVHFLHEVEGVTILYCKGKPQEEVVGWDKKGTFTFEDVGCQLCIQTKIRELDDRISKLEELVKRTNR